MKMTPAEKNCGGWFLHIEGSLKDSQTFEEDFCSKED